MADIAALPAAGAALLLLVRIKYRAAQFWRTLTAPLRPIDLAYAAARLTPALLALFRRMAQAEQQHGIAVAQALEAQGCANADLLTAALLHDAGKIMLPPRLWDRVLVVLGDAFFPQAAARWRGGTPRGWRRGFVIRQHHAAWGAALAAQAGATPRAVALIQAHHSSPKDDMELAQLQAVDDA